MSVRKSHSAYLLLPSRQWVNRVSQVMLVTLAVALLVMSKTGNPAVGRLRSSITDAVTPVLSVAARPMDALYNVGAWMTDMARLREQNLRLVSENRQLLQWQAAARRMQEENRSLRTLLNVVPLQKNTYVTVRVVSDLGGPYVHSALVNGGRENGIHKDEAVVNDKGLIGRVVDVGRSSARVLLLSDINSRVPVITEHTHEKSILTGNNTGLPTLSYLSGDNGVAVGERILTSGDGGVFPEGIPVGVVTSVDKKTVKVQPFVDPTQIEYVSVIDYKL